METKASRKQRINLKKLTKAGSSTMAAGQSTKRWSVQLKQDSGELRKEALQGRHNAKRSPNLCLSDGNPYLLGHSEKYLYNKWEGVAIINQRKNKEKLYKRKQPES